MDGSRNMGAATGNTATTGGYGGTHAGNGFGSSTGAGTTGGISNSTNAGPHNVSCLSFFILSPSSLYSLMSIERLE